MIFVDTGAWFASVVPCDANHGAAKAWLGRNRETLLTTDYILDETLTLLGVRNEHTAALALGAGILGQHITVLYYVEETDVHSACTVFQDFSDKAWSFADCTSKVVMDRLGLKSAFAFDRHFRQFGTVQVVP